MDLRPAEPRVVWKQTFTGRGVGVAAAGGRLYVADADTGLRIHRLVDGEPELTRVFPLSP